MIQVSLRIRDAPVLRRLAQPHLFELTRQSSLRSFSMGEVLLREGELSVEVFLLLWGRVSVLRRDSSGQNRVLALREAGAWIGEMGVVRGGASSATVVAKKPTRTFVVPRDAFRGIILTSDSATRDLLEILGDRLAESDRLRVDHVERRSERARPSHWREAPPSGASVNGRVALSGSGSFRAATRAFQAELIRKTLDEANGNVSEAARRLRIARSYLYKLIDLLAVPPGSRPDPVDPLPSSWLGSREER